MLYCVKGELLKLEPRMAVATGGFFYGMKVRYKYLIVTDGESDDDVTGKVFISGPLEYSSVKEGDEVIAEKVPYEDHHRFYYVTAMYTKRE